MRISDWSSDVCSSDLGAVAIEKGVSASQAAQAASNAAAQFSAPAEPPPAPVASQPQDQTSVSGGWMPQVADDADLIENEWRSAERRVGQVCVCTCTSRWSPEY